MIIQHNASGSESPPLAPISNTSENRTLLISHIPVAERAFGGELRSPDGGFAAADLPKANRQTRGTFGVCTTLFITGLT
jgi:hypothetical protein